MIEIERSHLTNDTIEILWTDDEGKPQQETYPLSTYEYWLDGEGLLDWNNRVLQEEEIVVEAHGKISMEVYFAYYFCDRDLMKFVKAMKKS